MLSNVPNLIVAHPLFRSKSGGRAGKPVHGIVGLKMAILLDDLKERFIDKNKTVFGSAVVLLQYFTQNIIFLLSEFR